MQSGRSRSRHLVEGGAHRVGSARELASSESARLLKHPVELILRHPAKHGRRAVNSGRVHDDEIAEPLEEILNETTRVLARLNHPISSTECCRGIPCSEGCDDVIKQLRTGEPQQASRALRGHAVALGTGDELVKDRQRVTG